MAEAADEEHDRPADHDRQQQPQQQRDLRSTHLRPPISPVRTVRVVATATIRPEAGCAHEQRHRRRVGSVGPMLTWDEIIRRADAGNVEPPRRVEKTDDEWRAQLSPASYQVTRHAATERAFSSDMCSRFEPGRYECVCCGTLLFDADQKFESGTGWPSFTQPVTDDVIAYHVDRAYGMVRVETVCNVCDAHLGHVFPDGPPPTGLRFCMNAVALSRVGDH